MQHASKRGAAAGGGSAGSTLLLDEKLQLLLFIHAKQRVERVDVGAPPLFRALGGALRVRNASAACLGLLKLRPQLFRLLLVIRRQPLLRALRICIW